jgi:hypothetical protein
MFTPPSGPALFEAVGRPLAAPCTVARDNRQDRLDEIAAWGFHWRIKRALKLASFPSHEFSRRLKSRSSMRRILACILLDMRRQRRRERLDWRRGPRRRNFSPASGFMD